MQVQRSICITKIIRTDRRPVPCIRNCHPYCHLGIMMQSYKSDRSPEDLAAMAPSLVLLREESNDKKFLQDISLAGTTHHLPP